MRQCGHRLAVLLLIAMFGVTYGYAQDTSTLKAEEATTKTLSENQQIAQIPETFETSETKPQAHKEELDALLKSDSYSRSYESKGWERKNPPKQTNMDNSWLDGLLRFLEFFGVNSGLIGVIGKVLALLLLAVIVYFVVKNLDKLKNLSYQAFGRSPPVATRHIKENLPDMDADLPDRHHLVAQIEYYLNQGQFVMALSLLYRGTLRELSFVHELPIARSQTEQQCQNMLLQAKKIHPNETKFFETLIGLWQMSAYGHRLPNDIKQQILGLSQNWQRIYLKSSVVDREMV